MAQFTNLLTEISDLQGSYESLQQENTKLKDEVKKLRHALQAVQGALRSVEPRPPPSTTRKAASSPPASRKRTESDSKLKRIRPKIEDGDVKRVKDDKGGEEADQPRNGTGAGFVRLNWGTNALHPNYRGSTKDAEAAAQWLIQYKDKATTYSWITDECDVVVAIRSDRRALAYVIPPGGPAFSAKQKKTLQAAMRVMQSIDSKEKREKKLEEKQAQWKEHEGNEAELCQLSTGSEEKDDMIEAGNDEKDGMIEEEEEEEEVIVDPTDLLEILLRK